MNVSQYGTIAYRQHCERFGHEPPRPHRLPDKDVAERAPIPGDVVWLCPACGEELGLPAGQ